jgi:integrase
VTVPKLGGGRTRRFFSFSPEGKRHAKTFLQIAQQQQANYGTAAFSISERLRIEAAECASKLQPVGKTLTDATEFLLAHLRAKQSSISTNDAIERLTSSRKNAGRSERYCRDLRLRLSRFAKTFGSSAVASISADQINDWLASLNVAAGTRNTFRRDIRTLLSFCEKRGYCTTNEASKTERATEIDKPVEILTVDEANALLSVCDNDILPYVAISLFAGVRAAELQQLDWAQVDLNHRHIEITAAKSKTRRRRIVPISDNLAAWIGSLAKPKGPVTPLQLRKAFDEVKRRAGFDEWPQNAMRHSYGSYRLAQIQDAARVSMEMGNSQQMVFAHYREVVKPKEVQRYWNLFPADRANSIVEFGMPAA